MRKPTLRSLAILPLMAALIVSMGVDCCQEPFPVPDQISIAPDEGSELIQSWDFASCDIDWTSSATNGVSAWACGEPTIGPRAGVEGSGMVLATQPGSNLPVRMDESIASPLVDLSAYDGARVFLSVWHWYNFPGEVDSWSSGGGRVEVLSNGQWVSIAPAGGYDGMINARGTSLHGRDGFTAAGLPRIWRKSYFDVTPFIGPEFRVRFHAVNVIDQAKEGWYIDDVQLWKGKFSVHMPETDLGACDAGKSVVFAFDTCDEGFGVQGDKVWQCGVPTRDRGLSKFDGTLTDGPAFDRDDSGLTWGTELSGHLPKGAESALVSPAIDASGCANGNLKLGFWSWYHFSAGSGGFVQVYDGASWIDVAPAAGYPGKIGGRMRERMAYGHEAFVTTDDQPSGWQYQVIDLTPYINDALRVRFVVSADDSATRPGWYIDTVEVVRDMFDGIPSLHGTVGEPMCGLETTSLSADDVDPTEKRDPCTEGEVVLDWQMLQNAETDNGIVTSHAFDVEHPEDGSLCIVLSQGDSQAASTVIRVDSKVAYTDREAKTPVKVVKKIVQASGRLSHVEVNLNGDASSNAEIQILHLEGSGAKPILRPDGTASAISNFTVSYHNEDRFVAHNRAPQTVKMYDFGFDADIPKTTYGTAGADSVLAYVVQIMDTRRCRQIKEIRGWQGLDEAGEKSLERSTVHIRTHWDGRDESGSLVDVQGNYVFRVYVYPGLVPTFPSFEDTAAVPYRADQGGLSPSSSQNVGTLDVDVSFPLFVPNAGIMSVVNRHDSTLRSAVGGEHLSMLIYLPSSAYFSEVPGGYFEALAEDPGSDYDNKPDGWDWADAFPHLTDPLDMMDTLRIIGRVSGTDWQDVPLGNFLIGDNRKAVGKFGACGVDYLGYPVCADIRAWVQLPQDEALYRKSSITFLGSYRYQFALEHKDGFDSTIDTGYRPYSPMVVGVPQVTGIANATTSSMSSKVRWDEEARIKGHHLWSVTQDGTPEEYRVSLCYQDGNNGYQPISGLSSELVSPSTSTVWLPWWPSNIHKSGNFTFPVGEWPFNTDDNGAAADTNIVIRAVYSDTCDSTATHVYGTSTAATGINKVVLKPPTITDIQDGVASGSEITVDVAPGDKKNLDGDHLYWYRSHPSGSNKYFTGHLEGFSDNIIFTYGSTVRVVIPEDLADGTYTLVRVLSDLDSFSSEISGPTIKLNVKTYASIDVVDPDDEEWRSESLDADGSNYRVEFHVDNLPKLKAATDFKIYIGENQSCDYLASHPTAAHEALVPATSTWSSNSSGTVWFKIPYTVSPGVQTITFCSEALDPEESITKVEDFRVLGYVDTPALTMGTKHTCSGDVGTECTWPFGSLEIFAQVAESYNSEADTPGITEYYLKDGDDYEYLFGQQTEPELCNGIIFASGSGYEYNNILYCDGASSSNNATWYLIHRWGEGGVFNWNTAELDNGLHENGWSSDFFLLTSKDGLVAYIGAPTMSAEDGGDDAIYNLSGGVFSPDPTDGSGFKTLTTGVNLYHDQPTSGVLSQDHLTISAPNSSGTYYIRNDDDLRDW